jgi:large subunit ribosomal protein L19e
VTVRNQRRLAAELLGVGRSRVWVSDEAAREAFIEGAITRRDIVRDIHFGDFGVSRARGNSRGRWRYRAAQRERGKRRGSGSRKGGSNARDPRKLAWIRTIRPLRARLRELRAAGRLDATTYRVYYLRAKGGMYKSRAHLDQSLRTAGVLKGGK